MPSSSPLPALEPESGPALDSHSVPPVIPPASPSSPRVVVRVRRIWDLVRRGPQHHWLLLRALGLVIVVRLGLTFWSYHGLRSHLPRLFKRGRSRLSPEAAHREAQTVAWAVSRSARLVPGASCLTQAFAAQMLLAHRGEASRLHIGVAKNADNGKFEAHAWVEHREKIIIGGPRYILIRYSPIAAFDV